MGDKNRVYYGEYTLKHWIDLMLTEDIVLPDYQRYFVWDDRQAKLLIDSFRDDQFVPQITIGCFNINEKKLNIVLDGQQRLTSILCAYYSIFPDNKNKSNNKNKSKSTLISFANENDDLGEEKIDFIEWKFTSLIEMIKNSGLHEKEEIHKLAVNKNYTDTEYSELDFDKHYLGFSYIVPNEDEDNEDAQQKLFAKIFRNINNTGTKLTPMESREALYYLKSDLVKFFSTEAFKDITANGGRMDFVRYLALLSQYEKEGSEENVAKRYYGKLENYYEDYIYAVVNEEETDKFVKVHEYIGDLKYEDRLKKLVYELRKIIVKSEFESIIDMDLLMFGIIYEVVFKNREIPSTQIEKLRLNIISKANECKENYKHKKNPAALMYLRERIRESIRIYEEHINGQA